MIVLFLVAAGMYYRLARRPGAPAWPRHACAGCLFLAGLSGVGVCEGFQIPMGGWGSAVRVPFTVFAFAPVFWWAHRLRSR